MLKNDIAIIGLDSQFGEYTSIDQVARALYLGKESLGKESLGISKKAKPLVLDSLVIELLSRMLNALEPQCASSHDVHVIIIKDDSSQVNDEPLMSAANSISARHLNTSAKYLVAQVSHCKQLSEAMTLASSLISENKLVALIGLHTNTPGNPVHSESKTEQVSKAETKDERKPTISFDEHFSGYQSCEGIASLLLAPKAFAVERKYPIYASINTCEVSSANQEAMTKAVTSCLAQHNDADSNADANICAESESNTESDRHSDIALIEVSALADDTLSKLETSVLTACYQGKPLTRALNCVKSIVGESGAFSQVLGLLNSVLALHQRYIPGLYHWQSPKAEQLNTWQNSSFYFPTDARPRFPTKSGKQHKAAFSCLTNDSYCHMVLSEYDDEIKIRSNGHFAHSEQKLVLITASSEVELQQQLNVLESRITSNVSMNVANSESKRINDSNQVLTELSKAYYQDFQISAKASVKPKFTLSLLANSIDDLLKEVSLAKVGIDTVFNSLNTSNSDNQHSTPNLKQSSKRGSKQGSSHWQTPNGSYFTAEPVSEGNEVPNGNVCFMYPGIGATYLGLGRELFQLFPEIYTDVTKLADDIGSSLKESLLYPRSITKPDFNDLKQRDLALRGKLADIAEAGVAFSCVFTQIFSKVFKLKPSFAMGYSMGEVSMFAALGCWQQASLMSERLANSDTFNNQLSGDLLTLQRRWGLSAEEVADTPIWETYAIKGTLSEVEKLIEDEPRVFCTIINTPESLLIGGYPDDCLRIIKSLGVRSMPLNMANAIHSEPAKAEYDAIVDLYTLPVNKRISTKMYSSSCYLPIPQLSKAIATSIAKCLCERVDFPRLVNKVIEDGARVFIEMGPGRSLCSWLDKTLSESPKELKTSNSISVPVNAKGVSDEVTYLKAIAKLVSHGVRLDLHRLYYGSLLMNSSVKQLT